MSRAALGVCALVLCSGGQAFAAEVEACDSSPAMSYICGPVNAEDLVQLPGTRWVLSSSMAPGNGIYLIDSVSRAWSKLYTGSPDQVRHDAVAYGSCSEAPALETFVTHGLHLRSRGDGHSTLYVVSHGGREAIEVFDVDTTADQPALAWRGCVPMPDGIAANSVTSLRDGTLLATVLMHPGQTFSDVFSGRLTGAVYRWAPGDSGFVKQAGSELPGNNGIEVSADEQEVYVVSTGLASISVFSNSNPMRLLRATERLDFGPDNIHMAPDGRLITAGPSNVDHNCGGLDLGNVQLEEFAACPRGSVAATFDPQTLEENERWSSPPDARFSNATMALQVGDEIWIGTFSGNRIGVLR
ncbi:MAG: SMP-30/gluconolactonase/LRE family protein [Pseudomonadales bacterium]